MKLEQIERYARQAKVVAEAIVETIDKLKEVR